MNTGTIPIKLDKVAKMYYIRLNVSEELKILVTWGIVPIRNTKGMAVCRLL
jgi:hypothetical protein